MEIVTLYVNTSLNLNRVNRKWPYEKVEVEGTAPN